MLQLAIYDTFGGNLLLDCSVLASGIKASTGEHGFEACTFDLAIPLREAFRLYDRPGFPYVYLGDGVNVVFEGRLEDVSISDSGTHCQALGYWGSLSDVPYTGMWSDTSVARWRAVRPSDLATREPARNSMDTNNRIYIAPQKNGVFGSPNYYCGSFTYETPISGERTITTAIFDYALVGSTSWKADLVSYTRAWGSPNPEWQLSGNGGQQTGTAVITLATPRDRVVFSLYYNAAAATYTGETGDTYLRITSPRLKTAGGTDEIPGSLVTYVNAINPTQLSSSGVLIAATGMDLTDEYYEDQYPATILTKLASLGDSATPPREWETGVWENQQLYFRPRGSAGRQWCVDAASLNLERSISTLVNSAYGVYRDASGRTQRTAISADAASVSRYGVTRRAALVTNTTLDTQSGVQRDAYLTDHKQPPARASITINALYDATGGRWPIWSARSGDTLVIRNLPPTLSTEIDRIRSFRISHTEYDVDNDALRIEPEVATPSLSVLLTRKSEGIIP